MRQRGALARALARAGAPRRALPVSRLHLRTHRWLKTPAGGVPLHYLRAPRPPRGTRIDGRLTVRVLLAEARAARAASVHAWLVCMTAAREFVTRMGRVAERGVAARGARTLRWPVPGTSGAAVLLRGATGEAGADGRAAREALHGMDRHAPGRVLLQLLRSPGSTAARAASLPLRERQRIELTRVLHALASSRLLLSTKTFLRELTSRYLPPAERPRVAAARIAVAAQRSASVARAAESAPRTASAARSSAAAYPHRVFESLRLTYLSMAQAAREPSLSVAETARGAVPRVHLPVLRLRLPAMLISVQRSDVIQLTKQLSTDHRSNTSSTSVLTSAIMRLRTPSRAVATTPAARAATVTPRGYAAPAATLAFRRTPRAPASDGSNQARQLQQQVVRQVTQELAQHTPWRGQLEQAVLAPRVLRELADRVAGAIAGRQGLERYRRGL